MGCRDKGRGVQGDAHKERTRDRVKFSKAVKGPTKNFFRDFSEVHTKGLKSAEIRCTNGCRTISLSFLLHWYTSTKSSVNTITLDLEWKVQKQSLSPYMYMLHINYV